MEPETKTGWLHGPWTDLIAFDLAWIPPCIAFVWLSRAHESALCDYISYGQCSRQSTDFLVATFFMLAFHRSYTYPLVYGNPQELGRHRSIYFWAPIIGALLLFPPALYPILPKPLSEHARLLYVALTLPNGLWNVYHVMMQRYGILRAYSRRLGYGDARLEKRLHLSWLFCGILLLLHKYGHELIYQRMREYQFYFLSSYVPTKSTLRIAALPAAAWLAWITARWLIIEVRHFSRASLPKLAYAAATAGVLVCFSFSILLGFVAAAASHAAEYIVFVNVYARRRPELPVWIRRPLLFNTVVVGATALIYGAVRPFILVRPLFTAFMNLESYLHFLYDGLLWRMRDRHVSETVLRMNLPVGKAHPDLQ